MLQIFIGNLQTSRQHQEKDMGLQKALTGSRMMYAKSVEHAARKNTARKETAYESLAARCKSGDSRATSVVECRMRLIICSNQSRSVTMPGRWHMT